MSKISELSDGGSLVSSDYLIAVRSGGNVKVRMDQINVDQVDLGDNEFIRLGNSQDLTMVHTSTESIINQAGIGDLLLQKAGATKLTINASGIDVTGSVTADNAEIGTLGASDANAIIDLTGDTTYTDFGFRIIRNSGANGRTDLRHRGTGDFVIETVEAAEIAFETSDTERMRIDASGGVIVNNGGSGNGILKINGATGNTEAVIFQRGGTEASRIGHANSADLAFYTGSGAAERMRIDSSGNVGIGTATTNAVRLTATTATANHIGLIVENSNTADSFGMVVKAGNDANDYTADFRKRDNTNIMRIRGDGNVGIGTSSPSAKLDIAGETRIYPASGTGVLRFGSGGVEKGKLSVDASSNMAFETAGSERMRIDASGNLTTRQSTGNNFRVIRNGDNSIEVGNYNATDGYQNTSYVSSTHTFYAGTAGSGSAPRAVDIDASGNLLVGTTTTPSLAGLVVGSTGTGKNISVFSSANGTNGLIGIYQSNGTQEGQLYAGTGDVNLFGASVVKIVASTGGVKLTSGATSWVSNSDERAKDIIEPISNAVQKVSTLRSVIGKYKTDSEGTRRSFLIAQDVQAVLPEAVDATDEDNLGVRYTETIPLLVAAIKEQQAAIEALTARIAALES